MFDLPFPSIVLYAHAGIAALGVQRVAAAHFAGSVVSAVHAGSVESRCAGDEDDVACRHEAEVRAGEGGRRREKAIGGELSWLLEGA
jgi:hypothetical protein